MAVIWEKREAAAERGGGGRAAGEQLEPAVRAREGVGGLRGAARRRGVGGGRGERRGERLARGKGEVAGRGGVCRSGPCLAS